jgi:membrane protease YdiL (CAAX protease family)
MKPLTWLGAVPLFAVPSMALAAVVYVTIPAALSVGIPLAAAVPTQFVLVLGGMAVAAWFCAGREKSPGESALARLRLRRPGWKEIAAGAGVGAAMLASYLWLSFTGEWISQRIPLAPPAWLAEFVTQTHLLGIPLAGNWWPVLLYLVIYLFNVFGEELWWRGYILPRQEAALGGAAWILHGLYWNLFHWFFYWDIIALLPSCLVLSWAAQRSRSTWTAIVAHGILNAFGLVRVVMAATSA